MVCVSLGLVCGVAKVQALGAMLQQFVEVERARKSQGKLRGRRAGAAVTDDEKLVEAACKALGSADGLLSKGDLAKAFGWARSSQSLFGPKALASRGLAPKVRKQLEKWAAGEQLALSISTA